MIEKKPFHKQYIYVVFLLEEKEEWDISISLVISCSNYFTDQYSWTKQRKREKGNDKSYQDPLDHLQRIWLNKVNWIHLLRFSEQSESTESVSASARERKKCVNMMHKIFFFIVRCIFNKTSSPFDASNGYRHCISREILFDICLIGMFSIERKRRKEEGLTKNTYPYEYMYVFSYRIFDENVCHNVHMNMVEYPNESRDVLIRLMNV